MNLDLQWLQAHIGALTTEVASMRGEIGALRTELENRQLMIADLQDQLERAPQGDEVLARAAD